jgi:preprotein translocase SecE subunit
VLRLASDNAVCWAFLILVMVLAGLGLIIGGIRLVNSAHRDGLRAAVFTVFLAILGTLAFASALGVTLEGYKVDASIGVPVSAGALVVLLVLIARWVSSPGFEQKMIAFEHQGWFTSTGFKRGQGQRVRRGTIVGILVLAGCGIYTLLVHQTLATGPTNWDLPLPYATRAIITKPGDLDAFGKEKEVGKDLSAGTVWPLAEITELNNVLQRDRVKIANSGNSDFEIGHMVPKADFQKKETELSDKGLLVPLKVTPTPAQFETYPRLTILPHVLFTLPALLFAVSIWFAIRMVNYPVFADFLIATEAEMNKVSWTSRKNLIQDTIVVLVTVLLLTVFLFVVDQLWAVILTQVNVIQQPKAAQTEQQGQEVPW